MDAVVQAMGCKPVIRVSRQRSEQSEIGGSGSGSICTGSTARAEASRACGLEYPGTLACAGLPDEVMLARQRGRLATQEKEACAWQAGYQD